VNSAVALTIDVEWAHPEVLAYVVRELNARKLKATFFCTHAGIDVNGHERALHPNYRRNGNSGYAAGNQGVPETEFYRNVTLATKAFCPEAIGLRSHHLFWESGLAGICLDAGLRYVSNCFLPLCPDLRAVERIKGLIELPIYYMDFWDVKESSAVKRPDQLNLEQNGLKVLDFHPNLIYTNARSIAQYEESKSYYNDPERLAASRAPGRGVQTLFLELLDILAVRECRPVLLKDVDASFRKGGCLEH
jgi:hypothetical protein